MPSTLIQNGADGRIAKRQKINKVDKGSASPLRRSRIFTPFRVCFEWFMRRKRMLIMTDCWFGILDTRTVFLDSLGENLIPDHDIRWSMSSDLRLEAWLESCLLD